MKKIYVALILIMTAICCVAAYGNKEMIVQGDQHLSNLTNSQNTPSIGLNGDNREPERIEEINATEKNKYLICIDPGHQREGNYDEEPVGPNSDKMVPKVTTGTTGVYTKKPEYVLNLEISLLLEERLLEKGFEVMLTRRCHDVDISNKERAEMANQAKADLVIRIHADAYYQDRNVRGAHILIPSKSSTQSEEIYLKSKKAAEIILKRMKKNSEIITRSIIHRNDLSGFNWSEVPVILVETGFMTNIEEDKKLSDPEYQGQIVNAIAEGVEFYFNQLNP